MKKAEVMTIIEHKAKAYGFEVQPEADKIRISDRADWSESWVNFTVWDSMNMDFDLDNRTITAEVKVTSSVSRMGGNTSAEDLYKAADTIKRAADLISELDKMDFTYTQQY